MKRAVLEAMTQPFTIITVTLFALGGSALSCLAAPSPEQEASPAPAGLSSDSAAFLKAAHEAERLRVTRRISEEAFARMAKEPGTVILDARGKSDYDALRIKGSVNLPYTAMGAESLQRVIPDQSTRILIYCRNNILGSRPSASSARPSKDGGFKYPLEYDPPQIPKDFGAGLNIPTYITLYIYGYRNVWELDPVIDPNFTVIEFESGPPPPAEEESEGK